MAWMAALMIEGALGETGYWIKRGTGVWRKEYLIIIINNKIHLEKGVKPVGHNSLLTSKSSQSLGTVEASKTTVLHSSEGQTLHQVGHTIVVDGAHSRHDLLSESLSSASITTENTASETIGGAINHLNKLGLGFEGEEEGNRSEDFFVDNAHLVVGIGEDSGFPPK